MKKTLRLLGIAGIIFSLVFLAACGGGGRADEELVGKWISVSGEAFGVTLTGDDIAGFGLELRSGGKGVISVDGKKQSIKWTNDDNSVTVKAGSTEMKSEIGEDTLVFDDMLGTGMKITFAIEGSEAAKLENNLPEADKNMLGTWQSYAVSDVLGEPIEGFDGDELEMEFNADRTVSLYFDGDEWGTYSWSLLGDDWGSIDDEDIDISWDITDDGIEVSYSDGEDYYVFSCKKL